MGYLILMICIVRWLLGDMRCICREWKIVSEDG